MRGARRKATSKPVICLAGGVERGGGEERAETGADGAAQLAQAERGDGAIFAAEGNGVGDGGDGRHFEKAGQSFFAAASGIAALEQRLGELERDGRAAEDLFWIGACRVDSGFRMARAAGRVSCASGKMVIGDDEVEAEAARGFSFSEGAHAGVDGDDDANAVGVGRFKHARLHAVAVAEAMRDVKARDRRRAFRWRF